MKYINKQTGEIVEAQPLKTEQVFLYKGDGSSDSDSIITMAEFQEQYGQAMICPREGCPVYCVCTKAEPHICDEACGTMNCPACIPYVEKSDD